MLSTLHANISVDYARLASSGWLALAGQDWLPAGKLRGVSLIVYICSPLNPHLTGFHGAKSFESFVFTIAYNTSISLIRKKLSEKNFLEEWYRRLENERQVVNEVDYNDLQERTKGLINQLPKRRRQVYMMSREEGFTYAEISKKLGISVNTVENHIAASLKFLRQHLQDTLAVGLFFLLFL